MFKVRVLVLATEQLDENNHDVRNVSEGNISPKRSN